MLVQLFRKFLSFRWRWSAEDPQSYWEWRARKYGARAVLNLSHLESEYQAVTDAQWLTLYPYLQAALADLSEPPQRVLDFGCGPGRFTPSLAALTGTNVVGVDISKTLLALAPACDGSDYQLIASNAALPFAGGTFDIIWVVLVLGGITEDDAVKRIASELIRCLRSGGILFVVENTTAGPSVAHWRRRSEADYISMFSGVSLSARGIYQDLDETISVLSGKKLAG